MYCPKCFNDTLSVHSRGVAKLLFNGKQMDTSQFLYNIKQESPEQIYEKLREKIAEFFQWYSGFQNKSPIKKFEVFSQDFVCKNNCKLDIGTKFTLLNILFNAQKVYEILEEEASKYSVPIDIKSISKGS